MLKNENPTFDLAAEGLDPKQFAKFVEIANNQLAKHWMDDKRVEVVKLVIQVSKWLGLSGLDIFIDFKFTHHSDLFPDKTIQSFYPCLFFQLSDLITYFGQMVYDRLGKLQNLQN